MLNQAKFDGEVSMECKLAQSDHEALIAENGHLLTQLNIARREVMLAQKPIYMYIFDASSRYSSSSSG